MLRGLRAGCIFTVALFLAALMPALGQVVISEFMAVNDGTLKDKDGDGSDWIELENRGTNAVSLLGWHLTDEADNLDKWTFPAVTLPARGFLVVFASDKNLSTAGAELHTNFKLSSDGEFLALVRPDGATVEDSYSPAYPPQQADVSYGRTLQSTAVATAVDSGARGRYRVPTDGALGTAWLSPDFDDSGWSEATCGIGFDVGSGYEDYIATDIESAMYLINPGCYLRVPFTAPTQTVCDALSLDMRYDDGFVAYLNGARIASGNDPAPLAWDSLATADRSDADAVTRATTTVRDIAPLLRPGVNVLAIHGLNRETSGRTADFLLAPRLRLLATVESPGYLPAATPGTAADAVAPAVVFDPPGRTFAGSLAVRLRPASGAGVIRYTTNGAEPTSASPVFTNDLTLLTSKLIRARAFADGKQPGPLASAGYIALQADLRSFTSDLPLLVIENFGGPDLPAVEPKQGAFLAVFEPQGGRSSLTNLPTVATRIGVRRRGESTMRATNNKPNLAVEIRGETDADRSAGLLGMPADSDWILHGPYDWDRALIRNPLAFELCSQTGNYALRTRFCEVFLNVSGQPVSYSANFAGVYSLMERIKRGDQRVDIARLSSSDSAEPAVSGGYIFKADKDDPGKVAFSAGGWNFWHVYPADEDITTPQRNWLIAHLNQFASVLNGSAWTNPATGYIRYIDRANWIDVNMVNVLCKNVDWPGLSTYLHKDRSGPIRQGPPFDFDRAMESLDGRDDAYNTWDTPDWSEFTMYWWNRLFDDPVFWQAWVDRWDELRGSTFSDTNLAAVINGMTAEIAEAAPRHFAKWTGAPPRTSWQWEVAHLRDWLTQRANWIDAQFPDRPAAAPAGGFVEPGQLITLSKPAGTTLYYTLDGSDPMGPAGAPAAGALRYTQPFALTVDALLTARAYTGEAWRGAPDHTPWSPKAQGLYISHPPALVLTEVLYHPRAPSAAEAGPGYTSADFEFVELQHTGSAAGSLLGVQFRDGITFDFTRGAVTTLQPGEHVIVVRCLDAFKRRYSGWAAMRIAGEYEGSLNDGGEHLALVTADGARPVSCTYRDNRGWPQAADGAGHSLVPRVNAGQADGALDYGRNWRASAWRDGSPGAADPYPPAGVVLNEIGAHTDTDLDPPYDSDDWIELFNPLPDPVAIGGWYLSDDPAVLDKWRIPDGTVLAPGACRVFTEMLHFHTNRVDGSGFGLSKDGEPVYLSVLPAGAPGRVVDECAFKGQENGVSLGRYPDGAADWQALPPTPGSTNAAPAAHALITEIQYHPAPTPSHPENNANDEYVEVYNPLPAPVALWTEAGAWRVDGGIEFRFPPQTTLPPRGRAVLVPFDPATNAAARLAFEQAYALTPGQALLLGPYAGQLDNGSDRVALEKPQFPDLPGEPVSWIIVDEAIYFDRTPWPAGTDGTGSPLQRVIGTGAGSDPSNWYNGYAATPGTPGTRIVIVTPDHGTRVFIPGAVTITAAADPGQVTEPVAGVDFYDGTNALGSDAVAPYTAVLRADAPGPRTLTARLRDASGVSTSRQSVVSVLRLAAEPATGVTEGGATLRGALDGGAACAVAACWGTRDAGTNAAAWEHVADLGERPAGPLALALSGLDQGREYCYRWRGTADGREGWSAVQPFRTVSFALWRRRLSIGFPGYAGASALTNFPALVLLSPALAGFSYADFASPRGYDLRFAGPDGSTLRYEIERWDTNGVSSVWVRIPRLTAGTVIQAYWDYADAAETPPGYATSGATWSEGYQAVWHFNGSLEDATPVRQDAMDHGTAPVAGIVADARSFNGTNAWVDPGLVPAWYQSAMSNLTVTLWVRPTRDAMDATIFGAADAAGDADLYVSMNTNPRYLRWSAGVGPLAGSAQAYAVGQWQMVSLVLDRGTARLSCNAAVPVALGAAAAFAPKLAPFIGNRNGATNFFSGRIDEVRVSRVARSADWLGAAYATVARQATFCAYGTVQPQGPPPDADGDGLPDEWEASHFGGHGDAAEDLDGDGVVNAAEYVAGTNPTNPASFFALQVDWSQGRPVIWFEGVATAGAAYENLDRFYDLQRTTNGPGGPWVAVPGASNVLGANQPVTCPNTSESRALYRARTRLTPR